MNAPDPRAGCRCRGIALLDLLMVLAILGIVAAVAVRNQTSPELQLDAAARGIAADLLTAQQLAMETRTPFGLQMDVANHRTHFVLGNGAKPAGAAAAMRASGTLTDTEIGRLLAATARGEQGLGSVQIAGADFGGIAVAVFDADGSARDGGGVELRCDGSWLRVRLQAATGRVTVTAP